jgi:hypothetical protein
VLYDDAARAVVVVCRCIGGLLVVLHGEAASGCWWDVMV